MSIFQLERITVPFRGIDLTVREMSAGERETAKKLAVEKDVPFLHQVVFQQTEWPENAKVASVHALADEPMALLEELAAAVFRLSGLTEDQEAKKD